MKNIVIKEFYTFFDNFCFLYDKMSFLNWILN